MWVKKRNWPLMLAVCSTPDTVAKVPKGAAVFSRPTAFLASATASSWRLCQSPLERNMDLEKQAKILPSAKTTSSSNSIDKPAQVSLFDAVRKWTDAEGVDAFDIELDGNCLTPEQIQEIAHSEPYKDRLLAFNERLA